MGSREIYGRIPEKIPYSKAIFHRVEKLLVKTNAQISPDASDSEIAAAVNRRRKLISFREALLDRAFADASRANNEFDRTHRNDETRMPRQKKRRDYHRPGYIPPSRDNTVMLAGHFKPDLVAEFKSAAAEQRKTITEALAEAARDFITKVRRHEAC